MSAFAWASGAHARPGMGTVPPYHPEDCLLGTSPESTSSLFGEMSIYGTSPDTPLRPFSSSNYQAKASSSAAPPVSCPAAAPALPVPTPASFAPDVAPPQAPAPAPEPGFLHVSLATLLGCCEMLGHHMEDRSDIARQQDPALLASLRAASTAPLRDPSQRPLFTVAPLDVLVTRDEQGRNKFHIIEINGTGISGLTNMAGEAVEDVLRSLSELPASLPPGEPSPLLLVASSGTESYPPVSRTLHEKVLYIEALRRGFEAAGRPVTITNMTRLEKRPEAMPPTGPTLVLGYMKQFRAHFMEDMDMDGPTGRLMLFGRQVHAAINDRFVLNTCYQFGGRLDLRSFRGHNAGFAAGADKGVAYELYNRFFGEEGPGARFGCMARRINFRRAHSRSELISTIQAWLRDHDTPAVIKPQGTGCGHGIEFFFGSPSWEDTAAKVDAALHSVASHYNLQCGGLPFTVCEYLDTAAVMPPRATSPSPAAEAPATGAAAGYPPPPHTPPQPQPHTAAGLATTHSTAPGGPTLGLGLGPTAPPLNDSAPVPCASSASDPCPSLASKAGHKFELRVVVYRAGDQLRAFPSIAKVAREAFDPLHPDNKKSLINNITTAAKETAQSGSEFLLPLCRPATLAALGIQPGELAELCAASTAFIRYTLDCVQDCPALFGLPGGEAEER